jgi:Fe-S-cluster containining protein
MPTPPGKSKSVSLPIAEDAGSAPGKGKVRKRKETWYDNGLRFACTQCGNCCTGGPGYVWLTINDMVKIAQHLKMETDAFTRAYVKRVGTRYSLMEQVNYDCVFLTRDPETKKAGCRIYPVRPTQCRTWPFWNQNLRAPEAWSAASEKCPGMCDADAPLYDIGHIEKCRDHPESP